MRKLIFAMNLTLDGCCDHTKVTGDDDVHIYHANILREADTLVYGRVTYQLMFPFWPDMAKNNSGTDQAMNDFAKAFDSVNKVVLFSKTLKSVPEKKTRIVSGNLKEEIIKLKQETGKNIALGGVDLPSQILSLGLIDEFHMVYQPTIVGEGRRLFDDVKMQEKLQLKLVDSKTFKTGMVAHRFVKS